MWKFLIVSGIIELVLIVPVTVLALLLGYHGFRAGEMGTMVGIFSTALLLVLLPYILVKAFTVHGLRKRKPWAAWSAIILSLLLPAGLVWLTDGSAPVCIAGAVYGAVGIWCGVRCLRAPGIRNP